MRLPVPGPRASAGPGRTDMRAGVVFFPTSGIRSCPTDRGRARPDFGAVRSGTFRPVETGEAVNGISG